jgi:outer membrane protein
LPKLDAKALLLQQSDLMGATTGTTFQLSPRGGLHLDLPLFQASGFMASLNTKNWIKFQEARVDRVKQRLILDVASRYLSLLFAQKSVEIGQSQLERAQAKVASFQRQFDAGHVALLDLQREQILAKRAEGQLQDAQANQRNALGTLGLLIGETAAFNVAAPPQIRVNEEEGFEALLRRARLQRADLIAQGFAADAARGDHNAQWLGFLPSLNLQADLAGPFDQAGGGQILLQSTLTLQLSVPLFDGGSRYGALRITRAKSREEGFKLALLERGLSLEINGVLVDIGRKKALLENAEAILELTRGAYKSAENLFAVGRTTSLDLITAQSDLFRSESDVVEKRLDLDQARLAFAFVMGDDIRSALE